MKREYISPAERIIDIAAECVMMATSSISKTEDHADGNFQELSNGRRYNSIWGDEEGIWK